MADFLRVPTTKSMVLVTGHTFEHEIYGEKRKFFAQDGAGCLVLDYGTGCIITTFESEMLGWRIDNGGRQPGPKVRKAMAKQALDAIQLQCPADRFYGQVARFPVLNGVPA